MTEDKTKTETAAENLRKDDAKFQQQSNPSDKRYATGKQDCQFIFTDWAAI